MAKKKAAKPASGETATKVRKKKPAASDPAPGQQNLPGVEDDRDPELDDALSKVAASHDKLETAKLKLRQALDAAGDLIREKKLKKHSRGGFTVSLVSVDQVKLTKTGKK